VDAVPADGVYDVLLPFEELLEENALVDDPKPVDGAVDLVESCLDLLLGVAEEHVVGPGALVRLDDYLVRGRVPFFEELLGSFPIRDDGLLNSADPGPADRLPHDVLVAAGVAEVEGVGAGLELVGQFVSEEDARLGSWEDRDDGVRQGLELRDCRLERLDSVGILVVVLYGLPSQVRPALHKRRDRAVNLREKHDKLVPQLHDLGRQLCSAREGVDDDDGSSLGLRQALDAEVPHSRLFEFPYPQVIPLNYSLLIMK